MNTSELTRWIVFMMASAILVEHSAKSNTMGKYEGKEACGESRIAKWRRFQAIRENREEGEKRDKDLKAWLKRVRTASSLSGHEAEMHNIFLEPRLFGGQDTKRESGKVFLRTSHSPCLRVGVRRMPSLDARGTALNSFYLEVRLFVFMKTYTGEYHRDYHVLSVETISESLPFISHPSQSFPSPANAHSHAGENAILTA